MYNLQLPTLPFLEHLMLAIQYNRMQKDNVFYFYMLSELLLWSHINGAPKVIILATVQAMHESFRYIAN